MGREVQLTIIGRQTDEFGETDETKTTVRAEYYKKNDTHYIFYTENPGSEDSSSHTVVKNTIKWKDSVLELTRKGSVGTRMVFIPDEEYLTDYVTPLGCLKLEIHTHTVHCKVVKELPQIQAEYSLFSDGRFISECSITIDLK